MHAVSFGGPGLYALWAFAYGSLAGALFVSVDSLRRPASRFGSDGWRWAWFLPQATYATLFLLDLAPSLSTYLSGAVVALMLPAVVGQIAYLLRVVWPSPARLESMRGREGETGDDEALEGPDDAV